MEGNAIDHWLAELACGEEARAEQAAQQLSRIPPDKLEPILPALRSMLTSREADRRWWAVRALAEIHDLRVPGWLAELLTDPDSAVRQCAALGLRQRPAVQVLPQLVKALGDPDAMVASLAGQALTAIGEPAVPPLIEVVRGTGSEAGPHGRREAARALNAIGDPRAVPALYELLEDDSALLAYWAEQGLERMGVGMMFFRP